MIVTFNGETPYKAKDIISQTKDLYVVIKDEVEGDIHLSIKLKNAADTHESFTKYVVENSHRAEIRIFNASPVQYVRTTDPIKLGTYKNRYILKLDFLLEPSGADSQRVIQLNFFITKD